MSTAPGTAGKVYKRLSNKLTIYKSSNSLSTAPGTAGKVYKWQDYRQATKHNTVDAGTLSNQRNDFYGQID